MNRPSIKPSLSIQKQNARALEREALRMAFVKLLHREQRFGLRDDCRAQLDSEWDQLIELAEKFLGQ